MEDTIWSVGRLFVTGMSIVIEIIMNEDYFKIPSKSGILLYSSISL